MLGLVTLGSGAVGWLLGPFVGNAVFGMAHRRVGGQIAEVSGVEWNELHVMLCGGGLGLYELCSLDHDFCFSFLVGRNANEGVGAIEGERFLQTDKEAQGRSVGRVVGESRA